MNYKVKKGDTLSKIAKEHKLSLSELLKLNKIPQDKANYIRIGQEIKVSSNPSENRKAALIARITTKSSAKKEDTQTPKQESVLVKKPINSNIQVIDAAYLKENAKHIQQQLLSEKFDIGKTGVDGIWGKNSQAALDKALTDGYKLENGVLVAPKKSKTGTFSFDNPVLKKVSSDAAQYASNFVKSPIQATADAVLYVADIAGAPTNATNYLRDLNVSLPYRAKSAIRAGFNTIMGNKSWEENYANALANPGFYTRVTTIQPLTNTNYNFSEEELTALRDMAGSDFQIDDGDIKRVSEDKRYGRDEGLLSYFTPTKVIQTAIGRSSGNPTTKTITDVFDVNTVGEVAEKDNAMYEKIAKANNSFGYADLRASMPKYNMIDIIPDRFKIHTKVKYEK